VAPLSVRNWHRSERSKTDEYSKVGYACNTAVQVQKGEERYMDLFWRFLLFYFQLDRALLPYFLRFTSPPIRVHFRGGGGFVVDILCRGGGGLHANCT
jgi:hypothetical protein